MPGNRVANPVDFDGSGKIPPPLLVLLGLALAMSLACAGFVVALAWVFG